MVHRFPFKYLLFELSMLYSFCHSQGGVSQLYLISCSGPGIDKGDVVNLQCVSNPPNCSENFTAPSEVVRSYVLRLEAGPSTAVLHSTVSVTPTATLKVTTLSR